MDEVSEIPRPRRWVEVYATSDGWRWRLKSGNGEIMASGEAHTRKSDAVRAACSSVGDLPVRVVEG